jgi:hypothetical protein
MLPHPSPEQTVAVRPDLTLYASLELSRATWLVTCLLPERDRISKYATPGGDGNALLGLLERMRARGQQLTDRTVQIVVIQEAGLDGFWVHRLLEANGIESHVVDPASIAVPRRRRRAKTDAIDGETLLRTLLAWKRGEPRVCAMVVPPTPEEEDRSADMPRARDTVAGADSAHEPHQGSARRTGHHGLQSIAQGPPASTPRGSHRGRSSASAPTEGRDPARDRADRTASTPDRRC